MFVFSNICAVLVFNLKVVLLCDNIKMIILQVHYDLGGIYFQQGCSDPSVYVKSQEHFRKTRELLAKVDQNSYTVLSFSFLATTTVARLLEYPHNSFAQLL